METDRFRILLATSELTPWVKSGGLADVACGLSRALVRRGHDVRVVMPHYESLFSYGGPDRLVASSRIDGFRIDVLETKLDDLVVWLLRCPGLYARPGSPYADPAGADWPDNDVRFGVFGRSLAWLAGHAPTPPFAPDVLHLNDWPSALAAPFVARAPDRPGILFTIHNLGYQGLFGGESFRRLSALLDMDPTWWAPEALEFHGQLSFIKAGLVFADRLSTVSPGYAREILTDELGFGLAGLLQHRAEDLRAIVNGIDSEHWDPAHDRFIAHRYDADRPEIKQRNKTLLQRELGLQAAPDRPLAIMISRLVPQKGIDLVLDALPGILSLGAQLAVLGTGDADYERRLHAARTAHPGSVAFARGMNEALAHRLEAAGDLLLMPSRYEPCGLNQLYSMRYGTIPVVRRTGGLGDTVNAATGFTFDEPSAGSLLTALRAALTAYRDPPTWRGLQQAGMRRDFSWDASAADYERLYGELSERPAS